MIKVQVQVISDNLSKLPANFRKEAGKGVKASTQEGVVIAKRNAPVDTGELQGEIHEEQESELTSNVVSSVDHAIFQEFGTIHQPGTPYMTPMAEVMRPKFIQRMSDIAEKAAGG